MMHPLGSPYVRDQLSLRAVPANQKRTQPEGEFVLYWMQSTQRLDDNWALRFATNEADRLGRPLLIVHELDSAYDHPSARRHRFVLQAARELARAAEARGYTYRFSLARRRADAAKAIARVARRASMVVTDAFPTAGVPLRTRAIADHVNCRVVAVDSVGVVPAASFAREEYAARTIRPKLARLLDHCLEPVEDRAPRRALGESVLGSLSVDWTDVLAAELDHLVATSEVDHSVAPVPTVGGARAARERLLAFASDGLRAYSERRHDPSDEGGSSRLSPYLHFGQISPAEVAAVVRREGPADEATAFLDELVVWRELALNFCWHNGAHRSLAALPQWARRSLAEHERDPRAATYSLAELELGATHDDLWNAAQRELVTTGSMHNVVRMLWGKAVLTWTARPADAFDRLVHLNDTYALDGCDPNGYAGIQWCFGKFDRPFAPRPVWGMIRPMSLERARKKPGMLAYVRRWAGASPTPALQLDAVG